MRTTLAVILQHNPPTSNTSSQLLMLTIFWVVLNRDDCSELKTFQTKNVGNLYCDWTKISPLFCPVWHEIATVTMQFWTSFNWINSYFYFLKLLGPYSRNWPTTLTGHQYWGDLAVKGGICPAPWNMCHSLQIDYQVALECWPCSTLVQIQYCLGCLILN